MTIFFYENQLKKINCSNKERNGMRSSNANKKNIVQFNTCEWERVRQLLSLRHDEREERRKKLQQQSNNMDMNERRVHLVWTIWSLGLNWTSFLYHRLNYLIKFNGSLFTPNLSPPPFLSLSELGNGSERK